MMSSFLRAGATLAVCIGLGACVDATSATSAESFDQTEDPLALTFDALSAQSSASGDRARSEGFAYAAIAVRRGIVPSRIDIVNGGNAEVFDGFVSAVEWDPAVSDQLRAPAHRTLIAWRRTGDGLTRILTLTTPIDSAPVLNPLSMSPTAPFAAFFAGATAQYQETTAALTVTGQVNAAAGDAFWAAVTGYVKVRELSAGAACAPRTNDRVSGVTCQTARYQVQFDLGMHRLTKRPVTVDAASIRRTMSAREQQVNGVKLRLTCAVVQSTRGCA